MDTEDVVDRFSITWSDQERFAALSGDWNPIHMDPDFARRSSFGDAVVHGMNSVLTALERYHARAVSGGSLPLPISIAVQFPRPVFTKDELRIVRVSQSPTRLRLAVRSGTVDLVKLTINFDPGFKGDAASASNLPSWARQTPQQRRPVERRLSDGNGLEVTLPFSVGADAMVASYPGLVRWFGEKRLASLALLSTVVGMEWPGLHSLFVETKIQFVDLPVIESDALTTRVVSADPDRGLTTAETSGPGILAETGAFFRPATVVQPSIKDLMGRIQPQMFKDWTGVVIGGSRGLGEIAAKLMAAGAADVVVTYRSGRAQAEVVAADIASAGARCRLVAHDVANQALVLPQLMQPNQPVLLFYSASPHIFRRRTEAYSRVWLDEFIDVYVDGFLNALEAVKRWTTGPIAVVYPSSEALEEPMAQLVEYAAAKAAGEAACRSFVAGDPRISVELPRLPRLLTDQTNSIIHVDTADPVDVLMPILTRLMHRAPSVSLS